MSCNLIVFGCGYNGFPHLKLKKLWPKADPEESQRNGLQLQIVLNAWMLELGIFPSALHPHYYGFFELPKIFAVATAGRVFHCAGSKCDNYRHEP